MFIIVPKHHSRAPPAHPDPPDPSAPAASTNDDDRGPVRTTTACDSCRVRKTKCNGQRPCGPCQRKHIICVFSRPKERHFPVSPAQATLLQHQQRRLRQAVQKMAAVIAKHEEGIDAEPSTFDVLDQLARYAPTEINDEEDNGDEASDASGLHDTSTQPSQARKRQRTDETSPSTKSSGHDQIPAPALEVIPNPNREPDAGLRASGSSPAFDTMMQFMQSMRNGQGAPTSAVYPVPNSTEPCTFNSGNATAFGEINYAQPMATGPESLGTTAPLQQEPTPFDFTSLIDWETSLANFQNDQIFDDDVWNQDVPPIASLGPPNGSAPYSTHNDF